jgi:hypothetical protein
MAKFGSFNPVKGKYPVEEVEADFMSHKDEYVQLFRRARNPDDENELLTVFRLEVGANIRKIG